MCNISSASSTWHWYLQTFHYYNDNAYTVNEDTTQNIMKNRATIINTRHYTAKCILLKTKQNNKNNQTMAFTNNAI